MTTKGRPKKVRYIQNMPQITQFSPRGKPGRPDEVELTLDQFEAIKLADHQGFSQEQGAIAMHLSRASFGRILRKARKLLADAIVNGKIIRIRMGDVEVGVRKEDYSAEKLNQELADFKNKAKQITEEVKVNKGVSKELSDGALQERIIEVESDSQEIERGEANTDISAES